MKFHSLNPYIHRRLIFLPVLWLLLLCGCNQKDLLFPYGDTCKLEVRFLWDRAPGADPEGMTLLFYPLEERGEFWRFEVAGKDGGEVEIPRGRYTMLAVNNDLAGIRLRDWPYSEAAALTKALPHKADYAAATGMVYSGQVDHISVVSRELYCYPDSLSTIYNIVIEDVDGMERVERAAGILKGCASGMTLAGSDPLAPDVSLTFGLELDADKATFSGITSGFRPASAGEAYELTVRVTLRDGGAYEKSFPVTPLPANSLESHNVYIVVNGITLPESPVEDPDEDEVGVKVDVDGWTEIEIELNTEKHKE